VISELIGGRIRNSTLRLGQFLAGLGLTPNMVTTIGLVLNIAVAVVIARGSLQWGGVLLLIASGFDMLDGAVARASGSVTKFGGFLDSTIDRYSEAIVLFGLMIYVLGTDDAFVGGLLIFTVLAGSLLISYARARAEAAGFRASVGLLARPERVLLLSLGLIFGQLLPALWILAIGTHLTVLTRIAHVWRLAQTPSDREKS
jgi:CDP-diacylglycerol--glycerol-3-phosphate 3-phosphatidyltransferase